ncbi:RtcB family protein [Actinomycetospora lutea]|uniref:RtcB family protein n=1 Tax=Actinomycetospora lutea TaxID=663604 RepID=UPI0023652F57|nr:RtcB family protein [Actinomycetospora lutea]MDD7938585.1 RtcB family protein [Actinomycetospora lutea]
MEKINERLLNWASILDQSTREQAERTAAMPFIHPHVALMPDAHLGRGATVGSVIPTLRAIMPAAVGVDIGCGMAAVRTQFDVAELLRHGAKRSPRAGGGRLPPGSLAPLREAIERAIPLGAGHHNRKVVATSVPRVEELTTLAEEAGFDPSRDKKGWEAQLGTLGGGNHFIEVSVDEADRVWLFLHSGSRGVGNKIAQRHTAVAREACAGVDLPDQDLAYLTEDTDEFWTYIRELRWAQHYALLNREEMMDRVVRQTAEFVGTEVVEEERISCHHNYTVPETHAGEDVWVSRKGAIDATAGRAGLVPGSMGTASYVVTGKGEADSLRSSPHGAGRAYSRTKARATFTHEQLREAMAGIEFRDTDAFIDEIPAAYKDVDVVMADAADLVEVRHTLRQIVNVKGA